MDVKSFIVHASEEGKAIFVCWLNEAATFGKKSQLLEKDFCAY
jgi:hypothetical protein